MNNKELETRRLFNSKLYAFKAHYIDGIMQKTIAKELNVSTTTIMDYQRQVIYTYYYGVLKLKRDYEEASKATLKCNAQEIYNAVSDFGIIKDFWYFNKHNCDLTKDFKGLSIRASNALLSENITTRQGIIEAYNNKTLMDIPNFGKGSLAEVAQWLNS